ncbi:MAG TPA: penicillin-binding protein 2 [Dermatophilaceae bacterium]|nr:penicillin-binding protein 2 [Dermatophilaceae bacterium]
MNTPIRRVSTVVALLFVSLLVSTSLVQFVWAKDLNARPDNRRTLLSTYARERGQILVGDTAIARSVPSDDEFQYLRTYPQGRAWSHVTGWYSFFGAGGGLELAENGLLSGSSDALFYRRVSDLFTGRKPQGASLQLTLDTRAQAAAIRGLGDQRGAAVALDPRTGAILAMVSNPTFDPNDLASHDFDAVEQASRELTADPTAPLVNRAIGGDLYPPGSTFKVVTAAAALSSGDFDEDSVIPGPAELDLPQTTATLPNSNGRACGPGGKTTLTNAMRISCNTAFGWLGMEVGADAFRQQAARFGIGDELSVPMRVTPSSVPAELNEPQLAQSAIGQYDVRVTPLQVAMVSAGVANDGVVMTPYLVQSVLGRDLGVLDETSPEELTQAVTPEVAAQLTRMMEAVVRSGTGTAARISGVDVAGKTGTAEQGEGRDPHAWFTGFAPAGDPEVAVAVVVEDGGNAGSEAAGGRVAAPIAKDIMEAVLDR